MATDKKTIGITKANANTLAQLVAAGRFGSELDARRVQKHKRIQDAQRSRSTTLGLAARKAGLRGRSEIILQHVIAFREHL